LRACKKDTTHKEIAAFLERQGFTVLDLSKCGDGIPDMAVSIRSAWDGRMFAALVEAKSPGGRLNPKQEEVRSRWQGPYIVAETGQEAYEDLCLYMSGVMG
jgi:hypothetical protein